CRQRISVGSGRPTKKSRFAGASHLPCASVWSARRSSATLVTVTHWPPAKARTSWRPNVAFATRKRRRRETARPSARQILGNHQLDEALEVQRPATAASDCLALAVPARAV